MSMKFKVSKKDIKSNYYYIARVGYCNLQSLLYFRNPIAYSVRAEGWACDYYDIDNVIISSGYSPISGKHTKSTYEIEQKYDKQAQNIISDRTMSYEEQKNHVNGLLKEYINEVKQP